MANKDKQKKTKQKIVGTLQIGGGVLLGKKAITSSVPRLLGVRIESHSTSRAKAKKILKSGYIDPNYSGTGVQKNFDMYEDAEEAAKRVNASKGKVFITGQYPGKKTFRLGNKNLPHNPIVENIYKRLQRKTYRARSVTDFDALNKKGWFSKEGIGTGARIVIPGADKLVGRSVYVGGSDDYFRKNFVPDVDDPMAMMGGNKTRVFGNRLSATKYAINKEGLGNLVRKAPKSRLLAGAAIALTGAYGAQNLVRKGVSNLKGKEKKSDIVKVKGFLRKGKLVKGYRRRNKKNS